MLRCLVCHATFNTQSDMEQHLASHSKQFQCQFCSEAFHIEFLLDRHIQTYHNSTVSFYTIHGIKWYTWYNIIRMKIN